MSARTEFRKWLEDNTIPILAHGDDAARFTQRIEWQTALYDAGWVGLGWPQAYGGHGGDIAERVMIYEELAAAGAPAPGGIVGLDVIGPLLLHAGSEEQKQRYLRPLLRGDEVWCQCFSEPQAGSDLAAVRTRATRRDEAFVVTGHKIWTSEAAFAHRCALLVRTNPEAPKHRGLSLLLGDMRDPRVTVQPIVGPMGDSEFGEVFFDDAVVGADNLLGAVDQGWKLAMTTLEYERGPYAIRRTVELTVALDEVLDDLIDAGRNDVLDHDDARARVGRCVVLIDALAAQAPTIVDRMHTPSAGGESSIDKLLLGQVEHEVFGLALDLLGPDKVMLGEHNGLDHSRWIREWFHARSASVYGGSAEIQRNIIADRVMHLPKGRP